MQHTHNTIEYYLNKWRNQCDILDIELIIAHILKKDRIFIITHPTFTITPPQGKEIDNTCRKRSQHYPLAYILGKKDFFNITLKVTPDTLIPRPETELIIEYLLQHFSNNSIADKTTLLDIGTGSGAIAVTLATQQNIISNNINIIATDISSKAIKIAYQNAKQYNVQNNISFYKSDLLQNNTLQNKLSKSNHLFIIANLPYVDINIKYNLLSHDESASLLFEPNEALWSKDHGLAHYKQLVHQTIEIYKKNSDLSNIISLYEIDPSQTDELLNFINSKINSTIDIIKDLNNKNRIIVWTITK